jgi:hypothetical protein
VDFDVNDNDIEVVATSSTKLKHLPINKSEFATPPTSPIDTHLPSLSAGPNKQLSLYLIHNVYGVEINTDHRPLQNKEPLHPPRISLEVTQTEPGLLQ